jgi:hypothetical protein
LGGFAPPDTPLDLGGCSPTDPSLGKNGTAVGPERKNRMGLEGGFYVNLFPMANLIN